MNIVIDMNLSPEWVNFFNKKGYQAIHWSKVGKPTAADYEIMHWAKKNKHIVFTHDLDFGTILAATKTNAPSVIQLRSQDVTPQNIKSFLFPVLKKLKKYLEKGALISIDENKSRVRVLPI